MTIRLSSGLRTAVVTNYGLGSVLQYGHIRIYSGAQPPTADAPPSGTLLAVVSADGITPVPGLTTGGLELEGNGYPGELVKAGNWIIDGVASGTPGWWRFVGNAYDNNSYSVTLPRMDGGVGLSLMLGITSITAATNLPVEAFNLILPPY